MSFGDAFGFPFKNIPKVLTIALGFTIAIAVVVIMATNAPNLGGIMFITMALVVAQVLFLSGYGVRVVRHLLNGHEELPPLEILSDVGRGAMVSLAGLLYLLPLIGVILIGAILSMMLGAFMFIALVIVAIPLGMVLGWGILIGMARYAATEDSSSMFELKYNVGLAIDNTGKMFSYVGWNILLAIIYAILSNGFGLIYDGIFGSQIGFGTSDTTFIIVSVVSYVVTITFSILQQLSNLHLLAQLAHEIGIDGDKMKRKNDDFVLQA